MTSEDNSENEQFFFRKNKKQPSGREISQHWLLAEVDHFCHRCIYRFCSEHCHAPDHFEFDCYFLPAPQYAGQVFPDYIYEFGIFPNIPNVCRDS